MTHIDPETLTDPRHACEVTKRGDGGYRVYCRVCGWATVEYGLGAANRAVDAHVVPPEVSAP